MDQAEGRGTVLAFAALRLVGLGLSVGSGFRPSRLPGLLWRNWETASLQVILGAEDLFDYTERAKGHWGDLSWAGRGDNGFQAFFLPGR